MKKTYTLMCFLLFVIVATGYAQNVTGKFTLNGTINKPDGTKAILNYRVAVADEVRNMSVSDTIEVLSNSFAFSGFLAEPGMARLQIDEVKLRFAIEPSVMRLTIPAGNPEDFTLEGCYLHTLSKAESVQQAKLKEDIAKLKKKIDSQNDQDEKTIEKNKHLLDSLYFVNRNFSIFYAKENPDYFFGISNIWFYMKAFPNGVITTEEARRMMNAYSPQLRQTMSARMANNAIKSRENTRVGAVAPDFSVEDANGKTITLSDFRHKNYILIKAWASWCVPCVRSIPHIKELYDKYYDKGLDVIAISRDDDVKAWRDAINKYEIQNWHHVLAEKEPGSMLKKNLFIEDDIFNLYPIVAIPKYFLLDKEGIVIGSWDGAGKKNMKELDDMLVEIFKE